VILGRQPGPIVVSRDTAEIYLALIGASSQLEYSTIGTCGRPVLSFSRLIIQLKSAINRESVSRKCHLFLCLRWVSPQSPTLLAARGGVRVTQGAPRCLLGWSVLTLILIHTFLCVWFGCLATFK